jgi:hypothetical protein
VDQALFQELVGDKIAKKKSLFSFGKGKKKTEVGLGGSSGLDVALDPGDIDQGMELSDTAAANASAASSGGASDKDNMMKFFGKSTMKNSSDNSSSGSDNKKNTSTKMDDDKTADTREVGG